MTAIHIRGEDGEWKPLPNVRAFAAYGERGRVAFHVAANVPAKVMVRTPDGRYTMRDNSDDVIVSLADDGAWRQFRNLYPSPERLEGV